MTVTTEEAERLALSLEIADQPATAATIRSLAGERDALQGAYRQQNQEAA